MLAPGQEVGNYRIEGLVARGGQGVVYRARHVRLDTQHAVKMLLDAWPGVRERLVEEGRVQAHLRHPNIVSVTDIVEIDGELGLVAELVNGVPLDAWLATVPRPLEQRLEVFRQVCAGVGAAHAAGVVHRDIKPQNVLVTGHPPVARVTDFGVAKVIGQSRTLPGFPMGTPGYMAPEQLRDAAGVDARADIFALGCLLYELVAGTRPFPVTSVGEYAEALTAGRWAAIPDAPPEVRAAIAACLALDPAARPRSCEAVIAMLGGAPPPVEAVRTPTVPSPRTFGTLPKAKSRPPIAAVIAVAAGILLMLTALAGLGWMALHRAEIPESPPVAAASPTPPEPASPEPTPLEPAPPEPALPAVQVPVSTAPATPISTPPAEAPKKPASRAPDPAPAEPEPPAPPAFGRVVSTGDGTVTALVSGSTRVSPDHAPPGHYAVSVRFPDGSAYDGLGDVSVRAGQTLRVRCVQTLMRCVPE